MCNFKSAIVLRDESAKGGFRLLMSPWTESHSELCQIFKLNDGTLSEMWGGTLSEISEFFSGLIGTISKSAKIISDSRPKKATP